MDSSVVILIAEDDEGHFSLINRNLQRAGLANPVVRFSDGQQTIDYLFRQGNGPAREPNKEYILILDIRMPKIDGIEVLERIKRDEDLKKIPVIILTTTDDLGTVDRCHRLGCSIYIVKPVEYEKFTETIRKVGQFLSVVEIPHLNGAR
ncbi:MAG: response regulator [Phycisphaerae bacterium]|nr:response regulator [Phycisphaerae bacterium]